MEVDLAWPPGEPRIRLDSILGHPRDVGGSRSLLSVLGGEPESPLFRRPFDVTWVGGDLVVSDPGAGHLVRLSADGTVTTSPEGVFAQPMAVATCGDRVLVTDSEAGTVARLGPDLRVETWLATDLDRPSGIACVGDAVVVAETGAHRLTVLAADGGRRTLGGRGSADDALAFNFPSALTAAGDGTVWVGDTLNFRVVRVDLELGTVLASFGNLGDAAGNLPRIKGLAVDGAGRLWVSDAHLDVVALFDGDGTFLMTVGRPGSAPGELSFPAGIADADDGRVALVDSLNRRIQVFSLVNGGSS